MSPRPEDPERPATAAQGARHASAEEDACLDNALRRALVPPALPAGFQARLHAALARDADQTHAADRAALMARHEQELRALRRGLQRQRRDTLALVAGLCFGAGALATAALPWLQEWSGAPASLWMPSLALALGAAIGVGSWWWERAGRA